MTLSRVVPADVVQPFIFTVVLFDSLKYPGSETTSGLKQRNCGICSFRRVHYCAKYIALTRDKATWQDFRVSQREKI